MAESRPDLGLRWPSRLVATAAEDRLNPARPFPLGVQDPSSVFLAFIGREDLAEDLGANRFDGDSVRSSRKQQGLLLVSRFVG
jgi:hypothetical protein